MECHDMLNAQAELWNQTLSFLKSMSIKSAIELDIPNTIHKYGRPMTLSELHGALSLPIHNKSNLWRLLRMLTHLGFLVPVDTGKNKEDAYDLSQISRLVVNKTDSSSLSSFVLAALDLIMVTPSLHLGDWLKQDRFDTFTMAHGCSFWELRDKLPVFSTLFNDGMTSDSSFVSDFIINQNSNVFHGISSLVDVGGGCGSVAISIAKAFSNIECTALDLPQVVSNLPTDGIVKFVSGDVFSNIPPADAVLLKWILHDWSDEDCINILRRCKEAIPPRDAGGKLIIIDIVVGSVGTINRETQLLFDMLIMTLTTGRERDEEEWWNLLKNAGFSSYKITASLGVRSIIEVYP